MYRRSERDGAHSSKAMMMSAPSTSWIWMERSGVSIHRLPSRCDWKLAPSSVIFRFWARL
jgi:hypothetical protein